MMAMNSELPIEAVSEGLARKRSKLASPTKFAVRGLGRLRQQCGDRQEHEDEQESAEQDETGTHQQVVAALLLPDLLPERRRQGTGAADSDIGVDASGLGRVDEDLQPVGRQLDGNGVAGHQPEAPHVVDRQVGRHVEIGAGGVQHGGKMAADEFHDADLHVEPLAGSAEPLTTTSSGRRQTVTGRARPEAGSARR